MVAMKRKKAGQDYDEDQKLLHQATKLVTKEARRVKTFLLQQAIRKSKAAAEREDAKASTKSSPGGGGTAAAAAAAAEVVEEVEEVLVGDEDSNGGEGENAGGRDSSEKPADVDEGDNTNTSVAVSPASEDVLLIKGFQPLTVVKICLRRLGLAHTGFEGEEEVKVDGSPRLKKLVNQVFEHKRVQTVMQELQERVTQRRREKLAESEGRVLPGQGRGARGQRTGKSSAAERGERQQGGRKKQRSDGGRPQASGSAFVSLSGDAPSDEEWAATPSSRADAKTVANKGNHSRGQRGGASTTGRSRESNRENEPGWAGADRAAGWGRGRARSSNNDGGGRGRGRESGAQRGGRGAGRVGGRGDAGGRRGGRGSGRGRGDSRVVAAARGSGSADSSKEDSRDGADLHGSWAAKRALKEKEASATKAFSGKRITFGDDD